MAIGHCDNCNKFRPGASGESCGCEGFFCHICRGDDLDPYCEIEDAIEAVDNKLGKLILKAECGLDWAVIAEIEERELAPLLALRSEATLAFAMKAFDTFIANLKNWVEGARP